MEHKRNETIYHLLEEISARLDWIAEELQVEDDIEQFLYTLSEGRFDLDEAKAIADELWRRV